MLRVAPAHFELAVALESEVETFEPTRRPQSEPAAVEMHSTHEQLECHRHLERYRAEHDRFLAEQHRALALADAGQRRNSRRATPRGRVMVPDGDAQRQLFHDSQYIEWEGEPLDCSQTEGEGGPCTRGSAEREKCKCQQLFAGRAHLLVGCEADRRLTLKRCARQGYLDNHGLEHRVYLDSADGDDDDDDLRAPCTCGAASPTSCTCRRRVRGDRAIDLTPEWPRNDRCRPCKTEFERLSQSFDYRNVSRVLDCIGGLGGRSASQERAARPGPRRRRPEVRSTRHQRDRRFGLFALERVLEGLGATPTAEPEAPEEIPAAERDEEEEEGAQPATVVPSPSPTTSTPPSSSPATPPTSPPTPPPAPSPSGTTTTTVTPAPANKQTSSASSTTWFWIGAIIVVVAALIAFFLSRARHKSGSQRTPAGYDMQEQQQSSTSVTPPGQVVSPAGPPSHSTVSSASSYPASPPASSPSGAPLTSPVFPSPSSTFGARPLASGSYSPASPVSSSSSPFGTPSSSPFGPYLPAAPPVSPFSPLPSPSSPPGTYTPGTFAARSASPVASPALPLSATPSPMSAASDLASSIIGTHGPSPSLPSALLSVGTAPGAGSSAV